MNQTKSYSISKDTVKQAYERVRANKGAAGADGITFEKFEEKLEDNLYKIWNRMSSGSYFPAPVRMVEIPKKQGGNRILGVPTVADRIAQMVVKMYFERTVEPCFHSDSYGYRPGKSALDAVGRARKRCWEYDWVVDVDIKGYFDTIDHELMMKAVRHHTQEKWIQLYIERWLKAPYQDSEGKLTKRERGTPQGGVISPLLANLYLHYGFDQWMKRENPEAPFERYADDIIVHCRTEGAAEELRRKIEERLLECGLQAHPEKTKIVYCKDSNRKQESRHAKFDFLGYTFRGRSSRSRGGKLFVGFVPAVSEPAKKAIQQEIRSWKLHLWNTKELREIAQEINPKLRGWIEYYGKYHKSELWKVLNGLTMRLVKWARRKYKRFRGSWRRAMEWLNRIMKQSPQLFAHWQKPKGITTG